MATIVAAVGGGDWNTGASWVGSAAPTAADDAQVTSASGNMAIGAGAVARGADFTTYTGTLSGTNTLNLGDGTAALSNIALKLVAGMTLSGPPNFGFISNSATVQTVDFAGKTTAFVTFNSTSGSWQYTGAHTANTASTVTLTKGTLDVNGQTVSWGLFSSTNTNTRVLTLGASNITITGAGGTVWNCNNVTGLTLTANTANIILSGATAAFSGGSGKTYGGTVSFTGSGIATLTDGTCANITRTGTAAKSDGFAFGASATISSTLTINSNSDINRVLVQSNTVGTSRTITAASVVIGNTVDFMDIAGAGAATWTTAGTGATLLGDAGGNSGITFPAPATQTATGTASFTWSTHGWTSRVPLPQDPVVINNAFIAGQTVTLDMPRAGGSIDFTGVSGNPTLAIGVNTDIFGSLTLTSNLASSVTGIFTISFRGRSSYTIDFAGRSSLQVLSINAPSGTYTLSSAVSTNNNFGVTAGTLVTGNNSITSLVFTSTGTITRAITLGTSTVTITSTSTASVVSIVATGLTFSGASSTFVISMISANTRTFAGGSLIYGTLDYTVAGSTGGMDITGANTFSALKFSDPTNARTLRFTAATITILASASAWQVFGTSGKLMSVSSITAATHTISCASGTVSCDYVIFTNSIATGGATFYAGSHSVDNGGNSGWIFTDPPASTTTTTVSGVQSLRNLQNLQRL